MCRWGGSHQHLMLSFPTFLERMEWGADGTLLAETTFTGESASGWQEAVLPVPVPIAADTTYVASYHTSTGYRSSNYFFDGAGYDNPPLRALADGEGVTSVVTRGPARDDQAFAAAIVDASGGAARIAPETPTLADLAALFSRSRLYIGGDTGPMHLASLVGTPVVQILGPTDPVENAPFPGSSSRTVRVQIHCNPCRRGCAAVTCMRVIPPEMVVGAARELLAATATGAGVRRPLRA